MDIILIIVGIAMVLWGADRLTEGASSIAMKLNIPQIVIGLTIVAMGTSMPEFCVSLVSALKGTPDLAVGNVIGSNTFNTLMIVGITALVAPIAITKETVVKTIPITLFVSCLIYALCTDMKLSRIDAGILFVLFIVFMYDTIRNAKEDNADGSGEETKMMSTTKSICFLVLGLVCLVLGSNIFVDGATNVARSLGVSDAVIGLTIVAGGTSLPELATSVVAAKKGNSAIAIGNVLGSNIFNILMILGLAGLICPMEIKGITVVDFGMAIFSMLVMWLFTTTKYRVDRWEGAVMASMYIAYIAYLIYNL